MMGKQTPATMIKPEEAILLFRHSTIWEMERAQELYSAFSRETGAPAKLLTWEDLCLLSFVYDTGRIQGMREERKRV